MRNTKHFYIDGTFDCVPYSYKQLLIVMFNDPYTDHIVPGCFMLLNSKKKEAYEFIFK